MDFRSIILNLKDIGFYSVFLPFLLVYAIVYGVLRKTKIFTADEKDTEVKNINSVIAFVFALLVVASINTVIYIENFILDVVLFLLFLFMVILMLAMVFGSEYTKLFENKFAKWIFFIAIILIVLVLFLKVIGFWSYITNFTSSSSFTDIVTNVIIIVIVIAILYFISYEKKDDNSSTDKKNK